MAVYLVGAGRMGTLVAQHLAPSLDLVLVGRDPVRVQSAAQLLNVRSASLQIDFPEAEAVILALPTEVTASVLAEIAPRIPAEAVVINIATAVMRQDLNHLIPDARLASAKLVGHYYDMAAGGKATVVVDAGSEHAEAVARQIMGHCGPVVNGKEEWVLLSNRTATEEAVRLAIRMRRRLEAAGLPAEIIHQATTGVAVGSLRAFMDGKLGPFGQAIADRLQAEAEA